MLKRLTQRIHDAKDWDDEIALPFDLRERARCRTTSKGGQDVGIFVERGGLLKDGDCLKGEGTGVFRIIAQLEDLSVVTTDSPHGLARAAYHLGNRHVRLQVHENYLAYQPDHVLDEMIAGLGFVVEHKSLPFEPEFGAYHREGHSHSHHASHSHDHGHAHAHNGEHAHHSHENGHSREPDHLVQGEL